MIIQNPVFPKSAVETTTILATGKNVADGEGCRRCHGLVYDAEKMAMRSGAYHKMCFTCALCRRALDYLLAVDSPGDEDTYRDVAKQSPLKNASLFAFVL
jgi:hypothetical protein